MKRSPAFRLVVLWATLIFGLTWAGDAAGAHPCAHHLAIGHGQAAAGEQHGDHGTEHDGAPADHGGCTCVGTCHGSSSAVAPKAERFAFATVVTAAGRSWTPTQASTLPERAPYLLPYPTAPPRPAPAGG